MKNNTTKRCFIIAAILCCLFHAGKIKAADELIQKAGYINILEGNIGIAEIGAENLYGFQMVNGYATDPYFSIGFGVGVDFFRQNSFIPLFGDFRVNFLKGGSSPCLIFDIGYAAKTNYVQGVFYTPAIGVRVMTSAHAAVNFSFGYRFQEFSTYYYDGTEHFISIKVGVSLF